jgi:sugar lactone lactonase YvrE
MHCRLVTCALATIYVLSASVHAHPGSGIAVTGNGTIYFSDVSRRTIWKYSPEGELTPLLRDHWTRDLKLTPDGALYYEREGDANGSPAPRSLWRLKPSGEPERLIDFTHDLSRFSGEPFAVDVQGRVVTVPLGV